MLTKADEVGMILDGYLVKWLGSPTKCSFDECKRKPTTLSAYVNDTQQYLTYLYECDEHVEVEPCNSWTVRERHAI